MPRTPIFIVGSARSGTSATVNAFLAAGYNGFREGHFLPLAARIEASIDQHFKNAPNHNARLLMANINRADLGTRINNAFREVMDAANPEPPWFDKTGGADMIRYLPTAFSLWPTAGVVFLRRRAIENILSRIKKFPKHTFDQHCVDWAKNMAAWREVRDILPKGRFLEIDQYDMIRDAGATATALASFLGLGREGAMAMENQWRKTRPQETGADSATRIWTLESTGWSDQQVGTFRKFCDAEMTAYGYTLGTDYRAELLPA